MMPPDPAEPWRRTPARPLSRLPPLNALRAFVVAARHLSFSRAAVELHVTPAAVSQQVRQLEEQLGRPLFRRTAQGLLLTEAGRACLPGLAEGFERMAEALEAAEAAAAGGGGDGGHRPLTVSAAPSFASKWLLPRIEAFQAAHPGIDLRLSAVTHLVDFGRESVDCAIRYGGGSYPGLWCERLLSESVVPVASPELIARDGPFEAPADLARTTLLHDASPDLDASCPDWAMWLKAAGAKGVEARRGPQFNQSSLVLEAAILGRGAALAKARLADADVRAGRLVRLFGFGRPVGFAYYFVCPPERRREPGVRAFRDWLVAEAAREDGAAAVSGV